MHTAAISQSKFGGEVSALHAVCRMLGQPWEHHQAPSASSPPPLTPPVPGQVAPPLLIVRQLAAPQTTSTTILPGKVTS